MASVADVVFAVAILGAAALPPTIKTKVICLLIIAYPILSIVLAAYKLIKRRTWRHDPNATQDVIYLTSVVRSSAFYVIGNILLFCGAKLLGLPLDSALYNFLSLAGLTIVAYWYDRLVSSPDGYGLLLTEPGKAIGYSYLAYCSPAFIRFLVVLLLEIMLSLTLAHFLGKLLAPGLAATILRKTIVPIMVFSVVTGPLRFRWAYPTVAETVRISYLTPYMMAFVALGVIAVVSSLLHMIHKRGGHRGKRTADMLSCLDFVVRAGFVFMLFVALLLQLCGCSEAGSSFSLLGDVTRFSWPVMAILATVIVMSVIVIIYKLFYKSLSPLLAYSAAEAVKAGSVHCGAAANICPGRLSF